jgi:(5-formylfuran-3-yl)methyl phosphate synthase
VTRNTRSAKAEGTSNREVPRGIRDLGAPAVPLAADGSPPRLLVSVRSAVEAQDALAGGCDVLDVKEPANGSLGMADVDVVREILSAAPNVPVSAALGECRDWPGDNETSTVPPGVEFVKLGTAGLGDDPEWVERWTAVRRRFEQSAGRPLNWVAVSYADWMRCSAPSPDEIVAAAAETGCRGVLFDTFHKDGRTTAEQLSADRLRRLIAGVRERGLFSAVAGVYSVADVLAVRGLAPDVVAVRTLACADGRRNGTVCRRSVRRLCDLLIRGEIPRDAVSA